MEQHVTLQKSTSRPIPFGRSVSALSPRSPSTSDNAGDPTITAGKILSVLFDSACPAHFGRRIDIRPIWAEEAMSRAATIIALVMMLQRTRWQGHLGLDLSAEHSMSLKIASLFRSLDSSAEDAKVPVAPILDDLVYALRRLFGPSNGGFEIAAEIEPMVLSGYRRRALVLVCSALLCQSLLASAGGPGGQFSLSLERIAPNSARLSLSSAWTSRSSTSGHEQDGLLSLLARVLEADLVRRAPDRNVGTAIDLEFLIE